MDEGPTSAELYLSYAKKVNAGRAQQQRIDTFNQAKASGMVVPDLNPADAVVARMQKRAAMKKDIESLPPLNPDTDLRDRVARLEDILQLTLDSLNAATIECSGGDVVLTLPDLPT